VTNDLVPVHTSLYKELFLYKAMALSAVSPPLISSCPPAQFFTTATTIYGMHGYIKSVGLLFSALSTYPFVADECTQRDNWFMPTEETISTGVAIRVEDGFFRIFPYENPMLIPFEAAVRGLNPVVAVKLRTSSVLAAMAKV
jgi:hypothetical protein